ncbi:type IV pilus assembly protein PilQ [Persephonella hydrogeniphila]|uniref:Type IV pilus assembly protein PilQ n=1 Tax=Persephonella hydrogeniphila TaxID=198703 RepID=A0A285N821_9AQUI|nr:pilus assembly protein PilQ [Persephonella hydrogeniphila]SNZ04116.1 type IV pilus assembly protein PilQ [Persephonella hydrogeniphila]
MRVRYLFPLIAVLFAITTGWAQVKISAEFYGAKLSTVIDVVSELSNKNIIWDKEAAAKSSTPVYLTIRKPVSVETLFRLALKEYDLTYIRQGSIYKIKVAQESLITIPPEVVKYLGKDVFDSFVSIIKDNVSNTAEVKVYKASNAVYVRDAKENVENLKKVIAEFLKPLQKEAEKLAKIEEEKEKQMKEAALAKAKLESMLIKKEIKVKPEEFKAIEDELIENLSPYGKYSYDKKTGKLTIVEVRNNFSKISKILAKAQKIDIVTKCYYVRALEPAELLMTISENYLTKYGSIIFKSKETSKAVGLEKSLRVGGTAGTTTTTTTSEKEKSIITSLPKVCITDVPSVVDKIYKNFSNILLKRPYQIAIEARIVQIQSSFKRDLGIQWGGQITEGNFRASGAGLTTSYLSPGTSYVFDFPGASVTAGSGAAVGLLYGTANNFIDMRLSALEQIGKTKILSRPKVITIDGEGAEIAQGFEIPYTTFGTTGGAAVANVQFKQALLKLNVIPRTTPDGNIIMTIDLTQDIPDFAKSVAGQPPIQTKSVTSKVVAKDGQTIVIGGILEKTEEVGEKGVPGLMKIPILGWLFKTQTKNHENRELLIFITPKIIYE